MAHWPNAQREAAARIFALALPPVLVLPMHAHMPKNMTQEPEENQDNDKHHPCYKQYQNHHRELPAKHTSIHNNAPSSDHANNRHKVKRKNNNSSMRRKQENKCAAVGVHDISKICNRRDNCDAKHIQTCVLKSKRPQHQIKVNNADALTLNCVVTNVNGDKFCDSGMCGSKDGVKQQQVDLWTNQVEDSEGFMAGTCEKVRLIRV